MSKEDARVRYRDSKGREAAEVIREAAKGLSAADMAKTPFEHYASEVASGAAKPPKDGACLACWGLAVCTGYAVTQCRKCAAG